jgi:hypothetical protein
MPNLPQVASHTVGLLGTSLTWPGLFGGGTFALCLVALIKAWPLLAKLSIEAKAALRKEKRDEMDSCQKRIDALEVRLEASESRTHRVELRLVTALGAYRIIASELQRLDPDSAALMNAQALLNASYPLPSEASAKIDEAISQATTA